MCLCKTRLLDDERADGTVFFWGGREEMGKLVCGVRRFLRDRNNFNDDRASIIDVKFYIDGVLVKRNVIQKKSKIDKDPSLNDN